MRRVVPNAALVKSNRSETAAVKTVMLLLEIGPVVLPEPRRTPERGRRDTKLPTPLLSPSRGEDTEGSRVRRDGGTSIKAATASVDEEGKESLGGKIEGGKGEDGGGRGGGTDSWELDDIPTTFARDLPCSLRDSRAPHPPPS